MKRATQSWMSCLVRHTVSLWVTGHLNVSLVANARALVLLSSIHATVGIAVNRAAKGVKLVTGASGVGSAPSAQTAMIAGVIKGVTVEATSTTIGNVVVNGVTEPVIG